MERKSYSARDSIFAGYLKVSLWVTLPIVAAYIPIMPPVAMGKLHGSGLILQLSEWFLDVS